ncbi:outer membrane protein [Paucibacter oligotrophus]|uniref:Outer membrane protein n=1 Tax=Roseateles oligotrophus TaxID=1769250 RepID=A0A840LH67_9BURK|nr:MipA/OmpV family protein [Roseateles oligotrophus]MBB4844617.1 outer membrane protein [Roseateles oligotrophus]
MKILAIVGLMLLSACQLSAQAQTAPPSKTSNELASKEAGESSWTHRWGVGFAAFPKYPGSDRFWALPVPLLESRYRERFFISTVHGLGVEGQVLPGLRLGASLLPDLYLRRSQDLPERFAKLDEIKLAPALRISAELSHGPWVMQWISSTRLGRLNSWGKPAEQGSSLQMEAGYGLVAAPGLALAAGVSAQWMDAKLANTLLGINAAQAQATGQSIYTLGSGVKNLGLFARAHYQWDADWQLQGRLAVQQLRGDAANSPLVQRRLQPELFLSLSRGF